MFFGPWHPFFGPLFFGPGRISFGPGVTKNVEDLHVCFLDLAVIIFVDLDEFVLDLKELFWTEILFVFDAGFCFLEPCTCFVDLASTGVVGRTPMLCAHIGPDVFWTLALFFGPVHVLWTLHRAGGI